MDNRDQFGRLHRDQKGPLLTLGGARAFCYASRGDMVRPFILLQLSDLHFGEHSRFHGQDLPRLAKGCSSAIAEALRDLSWQEPVGLVLVTGDLAEAARPKEYRAALKFFAALVADLNVERSRVVFVPGNHDVSWTKCTEIQGLVSDGELDESAGRERLDQSKLARFDAMVAAFYRNQSYDDSPIERSGLPRPAEAGDVTALTAGAYVHDFAELEVSVAALNSCEKESNRSEDHVGFVSLAQAQAVLDHWREKASRSRLRVLAVHHNPVASPPQQVSEWAEWLRRKMQGGQLAQADFEPFAADVAGFQGREFLERIAEQAQVSLLLHGHHHVSDSRTAWNWRGAAASGSTVVLSAGSWSLVSEKLPAEQPVVMQLVRIDPYKEEASAVLLRYDPGASVAGSVTLGQFVRDSETSKHPPLRLSIPAGMRDAAQTPTLHKAASESPKVAEHAFAVSLEEAVNVYRARKQGAFREWKARGVGAGYAGKDKKPVEARLDEMYVPLEVVLATGGGRGGGSPKARPSGGSPKARSGGGSAKVLTPEAVFARDASMALIGPAGSGKTTWMKWTFRRLLERPEALPFFLELRALTAGWTERGADRRTIDAVLEDELAICHIDLPRLVLRRLLAGGGRLRPVLLVDGWDELGELGSDVRKRLDEFRSEHPHVLVVVSSRPHGEDRPAEAAGFDTFEIQPLSDLAIKRLVHQFHHRVYGEAETEADAAASEVLARLSAVPEAHALARTPLLLTMLLLLSREQPLPDRRHRLYDACLRNLLHAWLEQKKGALSLRTEWRPDDPEQRLRVVSSVAYRLQAGGPRENRNATIVSPRAKIVSMLPKDWSHEQREGFIDWLINSAGVLLDRSDDTITFAHLSFQEFLAAYYLFRTKEGEERSRAMVNHAVYPRWHESLRQWAGLLHDQDPDKLGPVLAELSVGERTVWLAGTILADGAGRDQDVAAWAEGVGASHLAFRSTWLQCAWAWAQCRQEERKQRIASILATKAARATWIDAVMLEDWALAAGLDWKRPAVLQEMEQPWGSEVALARSRAALGVGWFMPGHGAGVLLRLWPSRRSEVAISLQTLVSAGGGVEALQQVARARFTSEGSTMSQDVFAMTTIEAFGRAFDRALDMDSGHDLSLELGPGFVRDVGKDFGRAVGREFGRDFGREFGRDFGRILGRAFGRALGRNLGRDAGRDFGRDLDGDFRRAFGQTFGRDLGRDFPRTLRRDLWERPEGLAQLQRKWNLDESVAKEPWWPTFLALEISSIAMRFSVRSVLASDVLGPIVVPSLALNLFRLACRASLRPEANDSALEEALAGYRGEPLWPALARHLSRRSTPDDRQLLQDLASHPEQRTGVLSWCLRYYVRGDVMLQDGTVLTIDELCHRLGIEPPPLLEELPDELPLPDIAGNPSIGDVTASGSRA